MNLCVCIKGNLKHEDRFLCSSEKSIHLRFLLNPWYASNQLPLHAAHLYQIQVFKNKLVLCRMIIQSDGPANEQTINECNFSAFD